MCRKKRVIKKRVFLWLCVAIVFMMAGCGLFRTSDGPEALQEADSGANSGSWEEAKTTPYGK